VIDSPDGLRSREEELRQSVQKQVERMKRAEKERPTLLRQTVYLGMIGVMFVLPIVGGAYLGLWLDSRFHYYGAHWTVCLILLGLIVGAMNVYFFAKGVWE